MNEREMIQKNAEQSVRLSRSEEAWLDGELASEPQAQVASMVAVLPTEEPDLMWRSELSGRLHEVAARKARRGRIAWALRPAFGIGAAAVLSLVFFYRAPQIDPSPTTTPAVEAQVLSAHREAVQLASFWGSVRVDDEAINAPSASTSEYQWDETDLGTL